MPISQSGNTTTSRKTIQIIAGALIMGVVTFGVIVIVVSMEKEPTEKPFMTYIAIAFGGLMLLASTGVSNLLGQLAINHAVKEGEFTKETTKEDYDQSLLQKFQIKKIIGLAMLEGSAFLAIVCYFMEKNSLSLVTGAVLVLAMIVQFPTTTRINNWIEYQIELIQSKLT